MEVPFGVLDVAPRSVLDGVPTFGLVLLGCASAHVSNLQVPGIVCRPSGTSVRYTLKNQVWVSDPHVNIGAVPWGPVCNLCIMYKYMNQSSMEHAQAQESVGPEQLKGYG